MPRNAPQYELLDLFHETTHEPPTRWWCGWCVYLAEQVPNMEVVFLILLGFVCTGTFLLMDWLTYVLLEYKFTYVEGGGFWISRLALSIIISLAMALLSYLSVRYISGSAAGSGIPEMKCILSGVVMEEALSGRTLVAKTSGLLFADIAGLSIGKEGPFVHISSCLCNLLLKFPLFNDLRRRDMLRLQLMGAACAAGVTATFGAPVGGVLFSIEVTATYYLVSNLWKGIFISTVIELLVTGFRTSHWFNIATGESGRVKWISLFTTNFSKDVFGSADLVSELLAFTTLGVLCGLLGALFNFALRFLSQKRAQLFPNTSHTKCMLLILAVTLVNTLITFVMDPMFSDSQNTVINSLFHQKCESISPDGPSKDEECLKSGWYRPSIIFNLILFIIFKPTITLAALVLPIPCGLFTPVFAWGAAVGRILGEIVSYLFPDLSIQPAGYAVVGAAALTAGVTRTLSTAVIVFELTAQLLHMLPVLLAVVVATAVGNMYNKSIYDTILDVRGLPYLHELADPTAPSRANKHGIIRAAQVMKRDYEALDATASTLQKMWAVLCSSQDSAFPLVKYERAEPVLLGYVDRIAIESALERTAPAIHVARDAEEGQREGAPTEEELRQQLQFYAVRFSDRFSGGRRGRRTPRAQHSSRRQTSHDNIDSSSGEDSDDERRRVGSAQTILPLQTVQSWVEGMPAAGGETTEVSYNPAPFMVHPMTSLEQVHHIFAMLGLSQIYVVDRGVLKGIISKRELINARIERRQAARRRADSDQ